MKRIVRAVLIGAILGLALAATQVHAQRVKDLTQIQGVRTNQLVGYGLVVGLDGTGDQTTQTPFTTQSLQNMLSQLGVQLPAGTQLQLKNIAAVMVTAALPAFSRQGGRVYAMAQGNVVVAGAGASSSGSSVQINSLNAGRIPNGATVEREVLTPVGQGEFVYLESQQSDFTTATRIVEAVNLMLGADTATAVDARRIRVKAPVDPTQRVEFVSRLENIVITPAEPSPKVIINARTGSVVMNQLVRVSECAVAHGSLQVVISSQPVISQPLPFSDTGRTVVRQQSDIKVQSDKGQLVLVPTSASLSDLVKALNAVGATPIDLLAILQAMKAAGALKAELEII
jgi:flagellar P-ring protein precursor FlgI